ncbi:MAG: ABC transporter permease [Sphingomonas sp.]
MSTAQTRRLLDRTPACVAIGLIVPLLALLWWDAQGRAGGPRAIAFAPLEAVASAAFVLLRSGELLGGGLNTLSRAITGLVLGGAAGIMFGVAMAMSRPVDRLFNPLYTALRQVPLLGWLPLIGLWMGNGDGAKLLIVSLAAFYPTVLNSYEGMRDVERRLLDVGRLYGFGPFQRFRLILLPSALPFILTGVTQALAFAWIATIGTEILLGSGAGLGATMGLAQAQQRMDVILVAVIAVALLGFAINHLFARLRRHLLRWQGGPAR